MSSLESLRSAHALAPNLTRRTYNQLAKAHGWPSSYVVGAPYGSWNATLEAAGIPTHPYTRYGRDRKSCNATRCAKPAYARGYCSRHYLDHMEEHGHEYTASGGKYIFVHIVGARSIREHRAVVEAMLGRPLLPGETIHHKGSMNDNRPSQLELRVSAHGPGWTIPEAVAWAHTVIERYES